MFDKTASNFEQVKARGGKLVLLSDKAGPGPAGNALSGGGAQAPGANPGAVWRLSRTTVGKKPA